MSLACCKVILYIFAVSWIFWRQDADSAGADRRCINLLRRLLKNPPNNTKIAINIGLSKARYLCREGFNLAGQEIRTCKRGKWTDDKVPKCMRPCGKPENIPHSRVVGSSFNFNDQLRYVCKEGYTLNGPKLRTCGEDGKWSEAPTCEEIIPCGHRAVNTRAKIVGGEISQNGMWPWHIGLYRLSRNVPKYICGGALVSRQWVLTAAHCFFSVWGLFNGNANLYLIKAGDHNRSISEASQQEVVPEMIFVHPRFKWKGTPFFDGDIALVKLSQKLEVTEFVRTVCLPEKTEEDRTVPKTKGTVAGWGVTRPLDRLEIPSLNDISKVLRHATFTIQSDQLCLNRSGVQYNSTTAFCAGDGKGGKDACNGDSGGAFVREDSSAKWVAIGVVSWGNGCAQKDQYGYYTRVYPFLDWIKKTMGENIATEKAGEPKNSCGSRTGRGIALSEDCGLDLVLVFDASVSVNRYYFQTSLEFAKELLRVIGASKRAESTGVAAATEAKLNFNLDDSKVDTIDKAIKAIDNIAYVGWVSSYIRALKIVKNKVAPNARNDSHQVMMFITDGLEVSKSLKRELRYLRDEKNFEVYAVGVGRRVNIPALMSVASVNQDHNHVISVRKYKNLQEAVRAVVQMEAQVLASCQSPGDIAHGRNIGTDYSHNKTVRYKCDAEYILEGEQRLTCDNGKWNHDPPKCRASCQSAAVVPHGTRFGSDFMHGKTVTYICHAEYTIQGNATLTCDDGTWKPNPPKCKAPCGNPGAPRNGKIGGGRFWHNMWVTFLCDQNYQLVGYKRIRCNDGTWNGSVPDCVAVCPDPGVPANGQRLHDNFQNGKEVTFKCNENYDLVGNGKIRCNDGVWSSATPECKVPGICGGDLTTDSGEIKSPGFPSRYPYGVNCEWRIAVGNGSRITLTFLEFEVEKSRSCEYDYFGVYNGETRESASIVAKLCGTELPDPIMSRGPQVFLRFRSDFSVTLKGFKLQFSKKDPTGCRRTNKEAFRYCTRKPCSSNSDCRSTQKCLCDGDCGMSCVRKIQSCNFDSGMCSFVQDKTDDFDWTRINGSTPSTNTGPYADHTGNLLGFRPVNLGYYMYIETSSPRQEGDKARLNSPKMQFSGRMCLSFYYHMYGASIGTLNVYIKGGTIFAANGNKGDMWLKAEVDVNLRGTYSITFEGIRGSNYLGDIAIDDFLLNPDTCSSVHPRFLRTPSNTSIEEYKSTILICSSSSSDTNITWFKDGKALTGNKFAFLRSGNLLILRVSHEDEGWYVCNATNKAGTKLARAYLNVVRLLGPGLRDCGRPSVTTSGQPTHRMSAKAGSYPWMVSVWNTKRNKHLCGGSLVSKRWIVTAAHCFSDRHLKVTDLEVRLGKQYSDRQERGREQTILPDRVVIHPQFSWDRGDYDSDVALIRLRNDAVYTDYVKPICVPLGKNDDDKILLRPGNVGVVTGWSGKMPHGKLRKRLFHASAPIVSQTDCKSSHPSYIVTSNMFCAGFANGTVVTCTGDAGGPLAILSSLTAGDSNQRWVLAGVSSWGDGCGKIGKYDVFTRVSAFSQWINSNINWKD